MAPAPNFDTAAALGILAVPIVTTDVKRLHAIQCVPQIVCLQLISFISGFFCAFNALVLRAATQPWDKSSLWVLVGCDICTRGGYQLWGGVPTLDSRSSNCYNTLHMYCIKADLDSEEILCYNTIHFPSFFYRGICLTCPSYRISGYRSRSVHRPTMFHLNCSSNVSGSTITNADIGWERFLRELCVVFSLSIAVVVIYLYLIVWWPI